MRGLGVLLGAFASALALTLGLAAPAAAGGPTSVMLMNGGSAQGAALYTGTDDYVVLDRMTDRGEVIDEPGLADLGGDMGRMINITWLLHDVVVWRADQLYLDAVGGPVISRQAVENENEGEAREWRRVADPEELTRLLKKVGVLGKQVQASLTRPDFPLDADAAGAAERGEPDSPAAAENRPAATTAAPDSATTNLWWTLPGAAAGALLAIAATHLRHRSRSRAEPGPRQELAEL
jgi:hypothetical protein